MKKIVKEIRIKPKEKLGSGTEHNVYPSLSNPNVVIKMPKGKIRMSWVNLFKEHPEIFPKITKQTDKYIVLEKLDTKKAESDYLTLDGLLIEDRELYDGDFAYTFYLIFKYRNFDKLEKIDEYFESLSPAAFQLYSKWRNQLIKFFDVVPYDYFPDLHIGQFGYSNDGTLKILDI